MPMVFVLLLFVLLFLCLLLVLVLLFVRMLLPLVLNVWSKFSQSCTPFINTTHLDSILIHMLGPHNLGIGTDSTIYLPHRQCAQRRLFGISGVSPILSSA